MRRIRITAHMDGVRRQFLMQQQRKERNQRACLKAKNLEEFKILCREYFAYLSQPEGGDTNGK